MLNSFNELTYRYMKSNKRRLIFTLIGIVLSITLVTAICSFVPSAEEATLNYMKSYSGNWHLKYSSASRDFCEKVDKNPKVAKVVEIKNDITIPIKNATMTLTYFNGDIEDLLSIKLKNGNLPKNDREVAIDDWTTSRFENKINLGDKITFLDEKTNTSKELTVVGILIGDSANNNSLAYSHKVMDDNLPCNLLVQFKVNQYLKETVNEFKNLSTKENKVSSNDPLLSCLKAGENSFLYSTVIALVTLLIFIIAISTIAIIYNAFNMSVSQRLKELGILRTIGASPKQIKKLVKREALLISLIAIPLGIIFGLLSLKFILFILNNMTYGFISMLGYKKVQLVISYKSLLLSAIVGFLTIYLSAILPARTASRITPLDSISSGIFIKKEKINRRTGALLKPFFKSDVIMAYKNLKRNKKRYRLTVFSMSISIVLVISVSSFVSAIKSFSPFKDNISRQTAIVVYVDEQSTNDYDNLLYDIKNLSGISAAYERYLNSNYSILAPINKINKDYLSSNNKSSNLVFDFPSKTQSSSTESKYTKDTTAIVRTNMDVYSKEKMDKCKGKLTSGNADFGTMENENGVLIVNTLSLPNDKKKPLQQISSFNVGDELILNLITGITISKTNFTSTGYSSSYSGGSITDDLSFNDKNLFKVKIVGILEETPFDMSTNYSLPIIMTPKTSKEIFSKATSLVKESDSLIKNYRDSIEITLKDNKDADEITSKIEKLITDKGITANCVNLVKSNANKNNFILQMNVFLLGLAGIIALIGAVNIINTINSNTTLRLREFASLLSIGMPMKQIRRMVVLEGAFYGIISSFWGTVIGGILSYFIIKMTTISNDVLQILPWKTIVIVSVLATCIGILSTIPGMHKLKKVNVIDVLKLEV